MCVLCYNWFESNAELEEHLKSVHENNMKLYGCKRCGKQFWSRFLRQRHEKQHRFDIKGPIKRYGILDNLLTKFKLIYNQMHVIEKLLYILSYF